MAVERLVPVSKLAVPKGLIGGPFGSSLGNKDYVHEGVPVIRGQNIGGPGRFNSDEFVYVKEEKANGELARNLAEPGDVVFTQRGTLGQVGVIPAAPFSKYVISQSQMRLRVDRSRVDPLYVYYCFRDPAMLQLIRSRAIVTGVPHINLGILAELRVPYRPLPEQQRIATTLGALDDKIDANRRLIELCDEAWYAQVRRALTELDGRLTNVPLTQVASFINGGAFTKDATGTGRMVMRISELNAGPGPSTIYNDLEVREDQLARPGDLLFAWSGTLTVKRWFRPEAIINQHIFKVVPAPDVPMWLVHTYLLELLDDFRGIAADKATTMGHIQRRHLEVPVQLPDVEARASLGKVCEPLWMRSLAAEREMLALEALRDALLHPLISGELLVADGEDEMEEAI